jgi:hypothetical protein
MPRSMSRGVLICATQFYQYGVNKAKCESLGDFCLSRMPFDGFSAAAVSAVNCALGVPEARQLSPSRPSPWPAGNRTSEAVIPAAR